MTTTIDPWRLTGVCVACGESTGVVGTETSHLLWVNRLCRACQGRVSESYLGRWDEEARRHIDAPETLPGAPWTAASVQAATRMRLLSEESAVLALPPDAGPFPEVAVRCSADGPFHARRGQTRFPTFVRWTNPTEPGARPRWLEDVTPSPAQIARWLNTPIEMRDVHTHKHRGMGLETWAAPGRAIAFTLHGGGWVIDMMPTAGGRSAITEADGVPDSRPDARRPPAIRFRAESIPPGGLACIGPGPFRDYGHLELRCRCGLRYRRGEGVYSRAFDRLAAAGLDTVELRDLARFA